MRKFYSECPEMGEPPSTSGQMRALIVVGCRELIFAAVDQQSSIDVRFLHTEHNNTTRYI